MKRYIVIIFMLFFCLLVTLAFDNNHHKLSGFTIIIDAGHGGKDKGTSYKDIYEKDINLKITNILKNTLEKNNAEVILIRDGDYDLSSPNASRRKKSDFDNRIKLINSSNADIYLSIHLNYFNNSIYKGAQVFYNTKFEENKVLADTIQKQLNKERKIKKLDSSLYMYNKLKIPGVLIECGFLSNPTDRKNLQNDKYLEELSINITNALIEVLN